MSIQKYQNHTSQMEISDTNYEFYSQSHALRSNAKSSSFFNVPLLFLGIGPLGLLDSDSVKSSIPLRSLSNEGQQKSWDYAKVGLSIIYSLEECSKFPGKILHASESMKASLNSQMITQTTNCKSYMDSTQAPKSLLKDFCKIPCTQNSFIFPKVEAIVLFEIGDTLLEHEPYRKIVPSSLYSYRLVKDLFGLTASNVDSNSENFALNQIISSHFIRGSQNTNTLPPAELNSNPVAAASFDELIRSLSASEIENSEDYTCVTYHGPNPKTTHIYIDCILETHANDVKTDSKNEEEGKVLSLFSVDRLHTPNQYPSDYFLSFCHHCNKKLVEGKDIYMYRGDNAFCSWSCRTIEIMIDEELEESKSENSPKWKFGGEVFEADVHTAI